MYTSEDRTSTRRETYRLYCHLELLLVIGSGSSGSALSWENSMRVAIIGTGYVGLTTGVCLAFMGHSVSCLDTDEAKIAALREGKIPIYEPFLEDVFHEAGTALTFTTSYAEAIPEAEVVFIAVGTPPTPSGAPNLEFLSQAAKSIGQHIKRDFVVVVNKSTVPIGSGNWVGSLLREAVSSRPDKASVQFAVASNPEFLREGSALHDSLYPGSDCDWRGRSAGARSSVFVVPADSRSDVYGAELLAAAGRCWRGAAAVDRFGVG